MSEPRRDLPGVEDPSPDVLDELLRAFSADETDAEVLAGIDLTSPEVDRLLAPPTPASSADSEAMARPADGDDGGDDDASIDDGEASGEDGEASGDGREELTAPAGPDDSGGAEPGDAAHDAEDAEDAEDDAHDAEEDVDVLVENAGDAAHEAEGGDGTGASDTGGGGAGVARVAGDPLLGMAFEGQGSDGTDGGDSPGSKVVSIVDSGLPDAVSLTGGFDRDGARSAVFIDDQQEMAGRGTTISVEDASAATKIEPRLRERRIAVKRAAGRKRLRWALAATVFVVLVVAALAVLGSGLFAVREVDVEGASMTDAVELQAVVDELVGTPVLLADTGTLEERLEAIPWVARARVTTQFPHGATIELVERTPVVTYQGSDGDWRVLDDEGRVLSVAADADSAYLPVTGADLPDLGVGEFASQQGFGAAGTLVNALGDLRPLTESLSVTADGSDLRLTMTDGTEVRFGPAAELTRKLVRLRAKLNELDGDPVRYIDVSTDDIGSN